MDWIFSVCVLWEINCMTTTPKNSIQNRQPKKVQDDHTSIYAQWIHWYADKIPCRPIDTYVVYL